MGGSEDTQTIAGFEILAKLSSGGMGDILLARRRGVHGFEKLLAIKTIRGDLARRPDIRAMFLDEARLVARLDHPTIAQVYDFGEHEETLFLAMEYVPGIALNKLLQKRDGPIPPVVSMRMIADVCRGLHAAHELCDKEGHALHVVHRDVTPGNLILTFDGHMKILDFGIAFMKGRESPDTIVGELKGKPSYMAPEHLRGEGVDRRADIYSVSVVLHELLTGRKLFSRDSVVATVLAVETSLVARPSTVVGPLPSALDEIVLRGLERKKDERFPDARSMASALDRLIASDPRAQDDSLESFVEAELHKEREIHRSWLNAVLSGTGPTEPEKPATAPPTPVSGRRPSMSIPSREVAPLVEPTTLIPPVPEPSQAVSALNERRSSSWTWLAIAVIAAAGSYVGYRLAFDHEQRDDKDALPIISDKPNEAPDPKVKLAIQDPPANIHTSSTALMPVQAVEPPPSADVESHHPIHRPVHHPNTKKKGPPVADKHEDKVESKPPPVEERPRPQGFGYVTVGAQPYALVRIDGQEIGATPIMNKKLPAGTHEIELVRPDSGEVRLKRAVTLSDGQHERITIP
jgi:serine/threonine protein kinase